MDIHTATEQAFKNGYEKGKQETAIEIYKWLKEHYNGTGWVLVETYFKEQFGVDKDLPPILNEKAKNDPVNKPAHYTDGKIEVIDFIEDKKLGFCLGNAIKYISRAGKKDPTKEVEDLKKARWYIDRRIKEVEESKV